MRRPQVLPDPTGALPDRVTIWEVGPRDGLQNEATVVPAAVKTAFIDRLVAAGHTIVEATSFVHPKWVPQLADAAEDGRHEDVARLVAEGASPDATDGEGWPALRKAAYYGHLKVLEILHGAGANLELTTGDTGQTALMSAAQNGHHDCVEALLRWGADADAARNDGDTALHIAAKMGEVDVVQLLLDERANVNARTHHDETPLMEAVDHGHQKVAELLIKFEADVNARTVSGKTALHGAHMPPR